MGLNSAMNGPSSYLPDYERAASVVTTCTYKTVVICDCAYARFVSLKGTDKFAIHSIIHSDCSVFSSSYNIFSFIGEDTT